MKELDKIDLPEDSKEEILGNWATEIMTYVRDIRIVSTNSPTAPGGELRITEDGKIVRPTREFLTEDLQAQKVCPSKIQVRVEGPVMNLKQVPAILALKAYAEENGKKLHIGNLPITSGRAHEARMSTSESHTGKDSSRLQNPELKGLTLLPEGIYTPNRLAGAIARAQMEAGFNIDVTSAIRSPLRQQKLYEELKGRQAVAPPGTSYHDPARGGIAIDVDNWRQAKPFLARRGFMHGEPGKGPLYNDPWHFVYIYKG